MNCIEPKLFLMTTEAWPSTLPAAGLMVMLLVCASPLPSFTVATCHWTGLGGRGTAEAAPAALLTTHTFWPAAMVIAPAAVTTVLPESSIGLLRRLLISVAELGSARPMDRRERAVFESIGRSPYRGSRELLLGRGRCPLLPELLLGLLDRLVGLFPLVLQALLMELLFVHRPLLVELVVMHGLLLVHGFVVRLLLLSGRRLLGLLLLAGGELLLLLLLRYVLFDLRLLGLLVLGRALLQRFE